MLAVVYAVHLVVSVGAAYHKIRWEKHSEDTCLSSPALEQLDGVSRGHCALRCGALHTCRSFCHRGGGPCLLFEDDLLSSPHLAVSSPGGFSHHLIPGCGDMQCEDSSGGDLCSSDPKLGLWGEWSGWSECDCATKRRMRARPCLHHTYCVGHSTETQDCGVYSQWTFARCDCSRFEEVLERQCVSESCEGCVQETEMAGQECGLGGWQNVNCCGMPWMLLQKRCTVSPCSGPAQYRKVARDGVKCMHLSPACDAEALLIFPFMGLTQLDRIAFPDC